MTYVQYIWILLSLLVAVTCSFCFLQPEWFVHSKNQNAFGIYAFCVKRIHSLTTPRNCGFYGGRYGFGNIPATTWQAACLLYGGGSLFMCMGALCSLATTYGFGNIPATTWQAACLLYGGGSLFMCMGALCSLATTCVRTGLDKTLVLTTRYLQISSVLLMTSGLVVYPLSLESNYFRFYCGDAADVFRSDECSVGWTFVLAVTGNALSIFCPILSYFSVEDINNASEYEYKL